MAREGSRKVRPEVDGVGSVPRPHVVPLGTRLVAIARPRPAPLLNAPSVMVRHGVLRAPPSMASGEERVEEVVARLRRRGSPGCSTTVRAADPALPSRCNVWLVLVSVVGAQVGAGDALRRPDRLAIEHAGSRARAVGIGVVESSVSPVGVSSVSTGESSVSCSGSVSPMSVSLSPSGRRLPTKDCDPMTRPPHDECACIVPR